MIEFDFNKNLDILEVVYKGDISLNDLLEFGNLVYTDNSLPRDLKILTDVSNANYTLKTNELEELINHIKIHLLKYNFIKAAYIQSKPKETAFSMLLSQKGNFDNYSRNVFSTREAAMNWLLH